MEDNKKGKIIKLVLGIIGLCVVFGIGTLASRVIYGQPNTNVNQATEAETIANPDSEGLTKPKAVLSEEEIYAFYETVSSTENLEEPEEEIVSPINFEELWAMNKDVFAWISIPGTEIEYPILKHATDNTYYLNHNIDGSYGLPGCIYIEDYNTTTFTDNHTVIYGHNMKNGTMFGGLHKFREKDFFDENKEIIIYTPDETISYTIFACYIFDDSHLMYGKDFQDTVVYDKHLQSIYNIRSMSDNIDRDELVTTEDKIITLVTCIGNQPNNRLLVVAKRNE